MQRWLWWALTGNGGDRGGRVCGPLVVPFLFVVNRQFLRIGACGRGLLGNALGHLPPGLELQELQPGLGVENRLSNKIHPAHNKSSS